MIRKAEEKWGSGIVEQVSLDLQEAFPESKGFSPSNLWRMKQWYLFYAQSAEKLHQLGGELTASKKLAQLGREISDVPSSANDSITFPGYFAFVPWKHHVAIVSKCESVEEALFYIVKCISEGWSRNTLGNCLHAHYYESCGGAITNFAEKLPPPQSEMAQEMTNYNVEKANLYGEGSITREHIQNNTSVREMLCKRGIKPEELPAAEDIKKLERRVASEQKKIEKTSPKLPKDSK